MKILSNAALMNDFVDLFVVLCLSSEYFAHIEIGDHSKLKDCKMYRPLRNQSRLKNYPFTGLLRQGTGLQRTFSDPDGIM